MEFKKEIIRIIDRCFDCMLQNRRDKMQAGICLSGRESCSKWKNLVLV